MLNEEYGAASDHGKEYWQHRLMSLKLMRFEPVANAIVRLNDTVAEYRLQGGILTRC